MNGEGYYKQINLEKIKQYFKVEVKEKGYALVNYSNQTKSIKIKLPFILNEDVATLAGLMPDGSLIKDLERIYFHQKKDDSKLDLFEKLLKQLFFPQSTILRKEDIKGKQVYINSKVLARFFYYILQIPKSDEQMRIPSWIFISPYPVKTTYLREAFAMEGTILKKLYEIRFITKDKDFAQDLQKLLGSIGIISHVKTRIGGIRKTLQYRLSIYRKENFIKFKDIGFSSDFHKKRFSKLLAKYDIR